MLYSPATYGVDFGGGGRDKLPRPKVTVSGVFVCAHADKLQCCDQDNDSNSGVAFRNKATYQDYVAWCL